MKKEVRNNEGKVIGFISNGKLCKKVKHSKHFMRVLNGWGFDKEIIENEDFTEVRILDEENKILYYSDRESWLKHGIHKNFGYGDQIILPLPHHSVHSPKQLALIN